MHFLKRFSWCWWLMFPEPEKYRRHFLISTFFSSFFLDLTCLQDPSMYICIIHGVICSLIHQLLLRAKDATFWVDHCEKLFLYKVRWPIPLQSAWFPLACFPLFLHRSILMTSPELQYRAGSERERLVELVSKRGERGKGKEKTIKYQKTLTRLSNLQRWREGRGILN